MTHDFPVKPLTMWAPVVLGPVALGIATGLALGAREATKDALALPAVALSVTVVMTPALYIGMNIIGTRRTASQVASALLDSLRSSGLIMAGMAPAVAFLLVSNAQLPALRLLAAIIAEAAAVLGIWTLFQKLHLSTNQSFRSSLMLVGWTIVSILLDAHLIGQWVLA